MISELEIARVPYNRLTPTAYCELRMPIVGYEVLVVAAILLVVFLWGPKKLPELARSIGLAKKEFEKTTKDVSLAANSATSPTIGAQSDPLQAAAKSLGISTEGKTKEQVAKEIADRTAQK